MKRLLIILATIALMTTLSYGQTPDSTSVFSGQFGVLMQDGYKGKVAYGVTTDISIQGLSKGFLNKIEVSVIQSDKAWGAAPETYASRMFAVKQMEFGNFHVGIGHGTWVIINTQGDDKTFQATKLEFGSTFNGVELNLGGDILDNRDGADTYFVYLSLSKVGF